MAWAAAVGSVAIPPGTVARVVLHRVGLAPAGAWSPGVETILLTLRVPRVAAAALVGAALAMAGALLQGMLRNPLADPYVVGTSGGAGFGAILGMVLGGRLPALGFGVVP